MASKLEATGRMWTALITQAGVANNVNVIAAPADFRARIIAAHFVSSAGTVLTFHSGGITLAVFRLAANTPLVLPENGTGWFEGDWETAVLMDTTEQVNGLIRYQQIK